MIINILLVVFFLHKDVCKIIYIIYMKSNIIDGQRLWGRGL